MLRQGLLVACHCMMHCIGTASDDAGRAVAMLLHMVFKLARTMAPSVIYIDEVEKVFVSDKKKAKEFGGQVMRPLVAVVMRRIPEAHLIHAAACLPVCYGTMLQLGDENVIASA